MLAIPDNIDSKYRFVILSALRARQLQGGSAPMVEENGRKPTTLAQEELIQGLVEFTVADAEDSKEE